MSQTDAAAGLAVWVAEATSPSTRAALRGDAPVPPPDDLLPQLAELAAELADLDRVVVAGPALVAQAIAATLGRPLTVLDTAEPGPVRRALADRLDGTLVLIAGWDDEADALRRVAASAFEAAGLGEAEVGRRLVAVPPPDAYGGALSAPGLAPAALAGIDVVELLDQAEALRPALDRDADNPALALAAALREAATAGRDKVALVADGTGLVGLPEWVARLLAETVGFVPVVLEAPDAPVAGGTDVLTVTLGGALPPGAVPGGGVRPDIAVNGPLGAQFLVWEHAAALLPDRLDPPVIESARPAADDEAPSFVEGSVAGYGTSAAGVTEAIGTLLLASRPDGYLTVSAYLDRHADAEIARIRRPLAEIAGRPVAFGWGASLPRGGGVHLQITGVVTDDVAVPGKPYTLGDLRVARAATDRAAPASGGRQVVRLHLTDRSAGIKQLLDDVNALRN